MWQKQVTIFTNSYTDQLLCMILILSCNSTTTNCTSIIKIKLQKKI